MQAEERGAGGVAEDAEGRGSPGDPGSSDGSGGLEDPGVLGLPPPEGAERARCRVITYNLIFFSPYLAD
ncbi:PREDICTED: cancer/testis antigen 1-like [Miniopterus natalensis]|uniref:cancer/testis antigen 1-like n=1 Tax=Miniopterus natalensis TaxID=291302 RepID=UPI0007A7108C|nr:PREDICTED: cancer/testis antigen 1-like [Miniopterus natalensis]